MRMAFSREAHFTGRNGRFRSTGVELWDFGEVLSIVPVTSKGNVGNCEVEIPLADLPAFIEQLQAVQARQAGTAVVQAPS